jgi:ABC-type lipoprotein release transport system permease subunit
MFLTYLRRELSGRKKQTAIIASGMALAIALVIVVNSVAAGVKSAQSQVLESVYGVGTDISVSQTPAPPSEGDGGGRFEFGSGDGTTTDGSTSISTSRLEAGRGTSTMDASALATVLGVENVKAAAGTLSLTNMTFSGEIPDPSQMGQAQPGVEQTRPTGGADGAGGSAFDVNSFTVLGLDPAVDAVGPLSAVELTDGRGLNASDIGQTNAVLDSSYATTESLSVGSTIDVGGTAFTVVGIVSSTSGDSATAANVYIPLEMAQSISGQTDMISTIYVQAESSTDIAQIQSDIETALPDTTVSTQADLASNVSGSLATASTLLSNLGLWLSIAVLVAAFLIAILFTISGVTRRTREFGTLKAIGWSNQRIVGQVAGESVVQGLIGGVIGAVVGLAGIIIINVIAPTLTGGASSGGAGRIAMQAGTDLAQQSGGFGGPPGAATQSVAEVTLNAPVSVDIIFIAVGLSVAGGLIAGALGGWRASRLSPAEALRSVN